MAERCHNLMQAEGELTSVTRNFAAGCRRRAAFFIERLVEVWLSFWILRQCQAENREHP